MTRFRIILLFLVSLSSGHGCFLDQVYAEDADIGLLEVLDADGDGSLDPYETLDQLLQLEEELGKGGITLQALAGLAKDRHAEMREEARAMLEAMDENGDSKVQLVEIHEEMREFAAKLDANRDKVISADEMMSFEPAELLGPDEDDIEEEVNAIFSEHDRNSDNYLTRDESSDDLPWEMIREADQNNDKKVSREEAAVAISGEGEESAGFEIVDGRAVMTGVINGSTPATVLRLVFQHPKVRTIVMQDVPGSMDDEANVRAARYVRRFGFTTILPADGEVASGGTDFFVAGSTRIIHDGAKLGIHSWGGPVGATGRDVPKDDPRHQLYLTYYKEMGIPAEFYWRTLEAAPASGIHWMDERELKEFNFRTSGDDNVVTSPQHSGDALSRSAIETVTEEDHDDDQELHDRDRMPSDGSRQLRAKASPEQLAALNDENAIEANTKWNLEQMEKRNATISKNVQGHYEATIPGGHVLVFVPQGSFSMGTDTLNRRDRPVHEVGLRGYWIGKCLVTNAQFKQFVEETEFKTDAEQDGAEGPYVYNFKQRYFKPTPGRTWRDAFKNHVANHPVTAVSWYDSQAFSKWLGQKHDLQLRLPTEAEWEKAARGADGRRYPWGNEAPDGTQCNFCDLQFAKVYPRARQGTPDMNADDGYPGLSPVDAFPKGASPYGVFDMGGNASNWVADRVGEYPNFDVIEPQGAAQGRNRGMRGGFWVADAGLTKASIREQHNCRSECRSADDPRSSDDHLGFRVAMQFSSGANEATKKGAPQRNRSDDGSHEGDGSELDEFFRQLDRNSDGKIQHDVVPAENHADFDETDTNGDKVVTRAELQVAFEGNEEPKNEQNANPEEEPTTIPRHNKSVSLGASKESLWTITQGEDWPSFLGANRDGKSTEKGILKDWSGNNLKIVWQRQLGSGYCNASICRGRAIVADRVGDEVRLLCMNAETGEHLWEYRTENTYVDDLGYSNGPRAAPVVDEDLVYIHGTSGHLICVDFLTGKEVWRVDTFKQFDVAKNYFGVASTPIVEGDKLLVMVGGSTKESQKAYARSSRDYKLLKPNGSCVVAFDKRTGEVIYKSGNYLCGWSSINTATIEGQRWGFAYARHGLLGFNPANGCEEFYVDWQPRNWRKTSIATPVVVNDTVLISESYGPGALYLKISNAEPKQEVIWQDGNRVRKKKLQTCISTAIHLDGYLYGCSSKGPAGGDFRCVKLSTGELMWKEQVLVGLGNATYVDGHFIVTAEYGQLMLIKATPKMFELVTEYTPPTDEFPNRIQFSKPFWAAPVVSHGLLYLRDAENLYCFQLRNTAVVRSSDIAADPVRNNATTTKGTLAKAKIEYLEEPDNEIDDFFGDLDRNGDGKVQRNEVSEENHANFDEADANNDDIVTRDELKDAMSGDESSASYIPRMMTEKYFAIGNPDADTVIVNTQGGPMPELLTDEFTEIFSNVDLTHAYVVNVHQAQTMHPEKANKEDISFEQAKAINTESVNMLAEVVGDFVRQKKRVYVVGISFGAWMVQDLLATQGSIADGYLIQAGRLDMPDKIWKSFAAGGGGYFKDGITPIIEEPEDVDDPSKLSAEELVEMNLPKIAAGLGYKRFTQLLVDVDLSKVTYMYGKKDRAVGRLSEAELAFLKRKQVTIVAFPGGHGGAKMDKKTTGIINQFVSATVHSHSGKKKSR